jgi:hypothetical protein
MRDPLGNGDIRSWIVGILVALIWLSCSSASAQSDARVVPDTWRESVTTNCQTNPGDCKPTPDQVCGPFCQSQTGYQLAAACDPREFRVLHRFNYNDTTTDSGPYLHYNTRINQVPIGLNAQSKFYGRCYCSCRHLTSGALYPLVSTPLKQVFADAECPSSGQSVIPSFYPASCSGPSGGPVAGSCVASFGASVQISTPLPTGVSAISLGAVCVNGCSYIYASVTEVAGNAVGVGVGLGIACSGGATTGNPGTVYTGGGGSGTSSGGGLTTQQAADLAAVRTASESSASRLASVVSETQRVATATEALASAVAPSSDPLMSQLESEGTSLLAQGDRMRTVEGFATEAGIPSQTVDFSQAFSQFQVQLFGRPNSCHPSTPMFEWNGTTIHFHYNVICEYAGMIAALLIMASSVRGMAIVLNG